MTSSAPAPLPPHSAATPQPAPRPEVSDGARARLGAEGLHPVSPKLVPARYLAGIPGYVIGVLLTAGAVVAGVLTGWWWLGLLGVLPLIAVVQGLALTPRRVRAIGYRDAEEDLTVALGIMFRTVHTIPYGRVQSVKIDEGPIDRRYGLAKLTLSTAHDGAGVTLPGLPKDEAERLRALLTARGVELMAAL
jgi:membrane protein YdbS with pleckstrin-like domain